MERLPNSAPSLLIGVPAIDKELIRQLDYLDGNPGALLDSARFFDVPSQLGEQINRHFTNKERIFKSFGMPEDIVRAPRGRSYENTRQIHST